MWFRVKKNHRSFAVADPLPESVTRRRVSFCNEYGVFAPDLVVTTHIIEHISDEDKKNVYTSIEEEKSFMQDAFQVASRMYLNDKLDASSSAFTPLMLRAFLHNKHFTDRERQFLVQWTKLTDRRGLEKDIVKELAPTLFRCQQQANAHVLDWQAKAKLSDNGHMSQEDMAKNYRRLAMPCSEYAQLMAEADAAAVMDKNAITTQSSRHHDEKYRRADHSTKSIIRAALKEIVVYC